MSVYRVMGDLVIVGDSVHWGQGLARAHKLHVILATAMRQTDPQLVEHFLAHSGAVIGAGATITRQRVDGEVPVGSPTIMEQAQGFGGNPADAAVVLVNGGINDVDIRNILNPFFPTHHLTDLIREHCFDSMREPAIRHSHAAATPGPVRAARLCNRAGRAEPGHPALPALLARINREPQ